MEILNDFLSMDFSLFYLFCAGILSGIINIFSAGGSFISLPILVAAGLSFTEANATNRLALLVQNGVSIPVFYKKKKLDVRGAFLLSIPTLMGAGLGAFIATYLDEKSIKIIVAIAFIFMLASLFLKPERWINGLVHKKENHLMLKEFFSFFLVGIYGGIIQAGAGIFLLGACVWSTGYSISTANPIKSFIIFIYTIVALIIFFFHGLIRWDYGLVLSSGSLLGGWIGAHLLMKTKAPFIRWIIIGVCVFFCLYFLNL